MLSKKISTGTGAKILENTLKDIDRLTAYYSIMINAIGGRGIRSISDYRSFRAGERKENFLSGAGNRGEIEGFIESYMPDTKPVGSGGSESGSVSNTTKLPKRNPFTVTDSEYEKLAEVMGVYRVIAQLETEVLLPASDVHLINLEKEVAMSEKLLAIGQDSATQAKSILDYARQKVVQEALYGKLTADKLPVNIQESIERTCNQKNYSGVEKE